MNVCSDCGRDFSTVPSFDDHRVGVHDYTYNEGANHDPPVWDGRRCLGLDELEGNGWRQDRYDRWVSPARHTELTRVEL